MVEQVARGRLKVAAVAALGLATVGMTEPANAAGKSTTMQIRVRVVEACHIRIDNRIGRPQQICGRDPRHGQPKVTFDPPAISFDRPLARLLTLAAARRRASPPENDRLASLLERVRFVTFTY